MILHAVIALGIEFVGVMVLNPAHNKHQDEITQNKNQTIQKLINQKLMFWTMNLDSLHPLASDTPGSFVCQSQYNFISGKKVQMSHMPDISNFTHKRPSVISLTSESIFSILLSIHFVWYWQGEFAYSSKLLGLAIISCILMIIMNDSAVL